MKKLFAVLLLSTSLTIAGQVGINTTTPDTSSMLDVTSTDKGMLVPRMTQAQRIAIVTPATSLLVYQTDATSGFWYYNGTAWTALSKGEFQSIGGLVQNTTNTAADDFVFGSTSLADIAGTNDDNRMFFNKSKGALRAGGVDGTKWNDANVGINSIALGYNTTASGPYSTAMGRETLASGYQATAMSYYTTASGDHSSAMSYYTTASGWASTAMGILTTASGTGAVSMGQRSVASGNHAVALGTYNTAPSYGELVVGNYATNYTAAETALADPADRLFSVGNGTSDVARSNAMTILKNGSIGVGTDTPAASALLDLTSTNKGMLVPRMTAAQRTAIATPATGLLVYQTDASTGFWYYNGTTWVNLNSSGEFKSIGGLVQNTTNTASDNFVFGSTALNDIAGTNDDNRMFFNKSKGAFRAGYVSGTQWDDASVGNYSIAMGNNSTASGLYGTAIGHQTNASGENSTAMGYFTNASGLNSTAMGYATNAIGWYSTAMGSGTTASGTLSTALGSSTTSSANYSTASGVNNTASGDASIVMGYGNTSPSYAEAVLGSYATTYTPVSATAFNAADRIFSVGNGTSTTRSNAMTILKNGRVGIGTDSPTRGLLEINGVGLGQGTLTVISHGNGAGTTALATLNGGTYGASAYSIWASGNIAGTQFHAYSDARIKKIAGVSDTANDLETLEKIEITNYKMVDSLQQGNKPIKKVIAQQIEKVYPQAVANDLTEVIPNIYKVAQIKNGWIDLVADVKVDDKIKLLFGSGEKLVTVTEVSAKGFKVNIETEGSVFVYGKEVHDFRAVDYEALSMLNISATQELLKRIKELEAEKNKLYNKMQSLENDQANTNSRLEQLEGILLKNEASADKPITNK